jgi:N-acetylmuramoyl-L-alanine amidase
MKRLLLPYQDGRKDKEMGRRLTFYRLLVLFFAVVMFLFPLAVKGIAQQRTLVVLLDPAHGGEDKGVVNDSLQEKDLTLQLALLIREESRKTPGIQVILTRSSDKKASIAERARLAVTSKADCLLSLHVNAGFGNKASGYELYFPGFDAAAGNGDSKTIIRDMVQNKSLNDSVLFSQYLQTALENVFPRKWRGLRDAPCPLLTGLNIPGLVLEIGFLTTSDDLKLISDKSKQQDVAMAIVKGLGEYARRTR